jgi:hypothetical protein
MKRILLLARKKNDMNKKIDEKSLDSSSESDINTTQNNVSGSHSTVEAPQKENETYPAIGDTEKNIKKGEKTTLVIPFEEYATDLTETQKDDLREYEISKFPDLFMTKDLNDDQASVHPAIAMSKSAKFYLSLVEHGVQNMLKKAKKKKFH